MRVELEAITDFKPIRLPKTVIDVNKPLGGRPMLHPGDVIWWRDITLVEEDKFGRVYGLLRKRQKPKVRTGEICVIMMSGDGSLWERFIDKDMVYKVARGTSELLMSLQWLFSSNFTDTPEYLARDCSAHTGWELLRAVRSPQRVNHHSTSVAVRQAQLGQLSSQRRRSGWVRTQVK